MKQAHLKVLDPEVVSLGSGTSIKASNSLLLSVTHPGRNHVRIYGKSHYEVQFWKCASVQNWHQFTSRLYRGHHQSTDFCQVLISCLNLSPTYFREHNELASWWQVLLVDKSVLSLPLDCAFLLMMSPLFKFASFPFQYIDCFDSFHFNLHIVQRPKPQIYNQVWTAILPISDFEKIGQVPSAKSGGFCKLGFSVVKWW